jgi:hypothetical protein
MKILIFFVSITFSANASSFQVPVNGEHPVCLDIRYASKDPGFYHNVYGASYKNIAKESFIYSLMASNVYEEYEGGKPEFYIHGWNKLEEKTHTWKGMGAHVYKSTNPPERIVIAFEGTNSKSIVDWIFGNLNLYWKGQYSDAEELIDRISAEHPDSTIVTTGHSLGGGLAIHAALYHKNVDAYAFNSSPRIFHPGEIHNSESKITLISENEDVLEELRAQWNALKDIELTGPYNEFDFLDLKTNNQSQISEHAIYYIARGLTIVAAEAGDEDAKIILQTYSSPAKICRQ